MRHRMRLDPDYLAPLADVTRQHHGIGADIGADIDEHTAWGRLRPQKIELLEIVVWIEQRAALGGRGLMIEARRRALIGEPRPDPRASVRRAATASGGTRRA